MEGYIYIMSNESLGELIKIGHTTVCPQKRARQLNSTGVPSKFIVEFSRKVIDSKSYEKTIHEKLSNFRENKNREFFKIDIERAKFLVNGFIMIRNSFEFDSFLDLQDDNIKIDQKYLSTTMNALFEIEVA